MWINTYIPNGIFRFHTPMSALISQDYYDDNDYDDDNDNVDGDDFM